MWEDHKFNHRNQGRRKCQEEEAVNNAKEHFQLPFDVYLKINTSDLT